MNSRKTRLILAIVAAAAIFGYKAMQPKPDANATASATPAGPVDALKPTLFGKIAFTPCSLSSPMSKDTLDAQCARFEVPEDRSQPQGRKIQLNIAWLAPGGNGEKLPDPVFFIAGGPGQSAINTYPGLDPVFREVRKQRNVILIDHGNGIVTLYAHQSQLIATKGQYVARGTTIGLVIVGTGNQREAQSDGEEHHEVIKRLFHKIDFIIKKVFSYKYITKFTNCPPNVKYA